MKDRTLLALISGGCVVALAVGVAIDRFTGLGDEPEAWTPYPDTWECVDPTPKRDGACRVANGGLLDTGLTPGWIRSAGPRMDTRTTCEWMRLSGPSVKLEHVIDMGSERSGPVEVHIESSDFAFWSEGCQPWQRVSRD
ncbi:hypothetical protein BST36_00270 [Mycolicibacterium moriokaense]|uniref:Uncharacterized protein n=1 Tax=Mycolicibacterium moriokaense TaxID=39691 RepID=A0AAD1H8H6_9MYCO|nr:hypothetical protein BST36_00270 [Mycolicibacterium moriokaense]BBX00808.1 hypothetical protein MMOR_17440 [Mycolicibacterium moriokaense]